MTRIGRTGGIAASTEIPDEAYAEMEADLGVQFSPEHRGRIISACDTYQDTHRSLIDAPNLDEVRKRLERVARQAERFEKAFGPLISGGDEADTIAGEVLICGLWNKMPVCLERLHLSVLGIGSRARTVLMDFKRDYGGRRGRPTTPGRYAFILTLAAVAQDAGITPGSRSSVSKDEGEKLQRFVRFVKFVMASLPDGSYVPITDEALRKYCGRALQLAEDE